METNSLFGDFKPYRETEENFGTGETQNSRYRNPRPRVLFLYVNDSDPLWNWIFLGLCVFGIALDPLFLYTPVIDDDKKSLGLDKKLGIVAIVLRSFFDVFHLLYIVLELRPRSFAPCFIYQRGNSTDYPQGTARKYLMLPVDLLSILPLPQVVILTVIRGSKLPNVMNLLKVLVIVQYVPRITRMYPFFTKARSKSAKLAETTWLKAVFNLLLYMLASHVFGALWYFLAIEKEIACWKTACVDYFGCGHGSFNFDDNLGDYKFLNQFCSTKTQNAITYDFGIYSYALETGIVNVRNFLPKFLLCFRWGLQNLSCFGQNLQTSSSVEENFFAIVITIFGLVLFLFLIGNMQIYLQSKTVRSEEMRLKAREIEQWMPFRKLSGKLQQQVKKYQRYVWREIKGVDVENLLNNLPKDLRRNIMRELCLDLLKKVPMFEKLDEQIFDIMCDRFKPVFYSEESYIIREGDPVDQMLIIMRGKLLTRQGSVRTHYLKDSDFLGEEVVVWALNPQSSISYLPISTTTVRALTDVEAFALVADDLKFVAQQFGRINSAQLVQTYKFYSNQWRTWAACFIQASWRSYAKKKSEESQRAEENRLQNSLAEAAGVSKNFGATIYATRFAANVVRTRRRNRKAKKAEGQTATLIQKPAEPEFSFEDQE